MPCTSRTTGGFVVYLFSLVTQAAFHVGPGWAPVGQSWAPNGPRKGLTGAHLGMLLGHPVSPIMDSFAPEVTVESFYQETTNSHRMI